MALTMRAVRAADRSISHFEGFTLDISERMKANQALRDSEERLRTLIDAMELAFDLPRGKLADASSQSWWKQIGRASCRERV